VREVLGQGQRLLLLLLLLLQLLELLQLMLLLLVVGKHLACALVSLVFVQHHFHQVPGGCLCKYFACELETAFIDGDWAHLMGFFSY